MFYSIGSSEEKISTQAYCSVILPWQLSLAPLFYFVSNSFVLKMFCVYLFLFVINSHTIYVFVIISALSVTVY